MVGLDDLKGIYKLNDYVSLEYFKENQCHILGYLSELNKGEKWKEFFIIVCNQKFSANFSNCRLTLLDLVNKKVNSEVKIILFK